MDKRNVIFIIVYTLIFSLVVALKFINNTKEVKLGEEFSIEKGQVVSVKNDDLSKIKLISIENIECSTSECNGLQYNLQVDGKEYKITTIPGTIRLYGKYELQVSDGDEDRLVLKMILN